MSAHTPEVQPQEITDAMLVFPGSVQKLMQPARGMRADRYWRDWQAEWFFSGLKEMPKPKPGIDLKRAMRHLTAIQRSFEPKHEDKEQAVACLAGLWFEKPEATGEAS